MLSPPPTPNPDQIIDDLCSAHFSLTEVASRHSISLGGLTALLLEPAMQARLAGHDCLIAQTVRMAAGVHAEKALNVLVRAMRTHDAIAADRNLPDTLEGVAIRQAAAVNARRCATLILRFNVHRPIAFNSIRHPTAQSPRREWSKSHHRPASSDPSPDSRAESRPGTPRDSRATEAEAADLLQSARAAAHRLTQTLNAPDPTPPATSAACASTSSHSGQASSPRAHSEPRQEHPPPPPPESQPDRGYSSLAEFERNASRLRFNPPTAAAARTTPSPRSILTKSGTTRSHPTQPAEPRTRAAPAP